MPFLPSSAPFSQLSSTVCVRSRMSPFLNDSSLEGEREGRGWESHKSISRVAFIRTVQNWSTQSDNMIFIIQLLKLQYQLQAQRSGLWHHSLVPRPHPNIPERGLVTLANYLICAESAYYVTTMWPCGYQAKGKNGGGLGMRWIWAVPCLMFL